MAGWVNPGEVVIDRENGCVHATIHEIPPETSERSKPVPRNVSMDTPERIRNLADHLEMQANFQIGGALGIAGSGRVSVKEKILSGSMSTPKSEELRLSGRVDSPDFEENGKIYVIGDRTSDDVYVYRALIDVHEPSHSMEP